MFCWTKRRESSCPFLVGFKHQTQTAVCFKRESSFHRRSAERSEMRVLETRPGSCFGMKALSGPVHTGRRGAHGAFLVLSAHSPSQFIHRLYFSSGVWISNNIYFSQCDSVHYHFIKSVPCQILSALVSEHWADNLQNLIFFFAFAIKFLLA